VDALNTAAFAGHTDWRVPNIRELLTIVDYSAFTPAVSAVFHTDCTAGCAVTTCSCTRSAVYLSATSRTGVPTNVWGVSLNTGDDSLAVKSSFNRVRVVRGP
jgi:hypothetical protein